MKKFYAVALLLLSSLTLAAQWRTPQEAMGLVKSFRQNQSSGPHRVASRQTPQLAYTHEVEGNPLYYAFNMGTDDGFVLVSGHEDAAVDVLGYSNTGKFDKNNMPDGLKWLLNGYAQELEVLAKMECTPLRSKAPLRKVAKANISPLIQTKWGQDAPFNRLCPSGCVTGCVPTAVSQIMYHYRYPTQGKGSHTYQSNGQLLTADFGATTYDWDNMLKEYGWAEYPDEKALAVATLLYHIGVSIEAQYGSSTSGSMETAIESMYNYFGYDDGMYYIQRDNYTEEKWDELIYNELANNRPMIYNGRGNGGGHAFIVDGYADEKYHINWGWDGYDDGYYSLSSLIPPSYAAYGGFTKGQNAYLCLVPADAEPAGTLRLESAGSWSLDKSRTMPGTTAKISGGAMNTSILTCNAHVSAIAVDVEDGTVVEGITKYDSYMGNLPFSYWYDADIEISTSKLTAGHSYVIRPVVVNDDDTYTYMAIPNDDSSMTLEILESEEKPEESNGEEYPRRMVVEELTASWCAWCVRGFVAMDYMKENYPDNFIGIAVHADDEMDIYGQYPVNLMYLPSMLVNRSTESEVSVWNMYSALQSISGMTAGQMVKIDEAQMGENSIQVTSHARFNTSAATNGYRMVYVILEDQVGPYAQNNAYSGGWNGTMDGWEDKDPVVATLYNDVARSVYPSMNGGSEPVLPEALEAGVDYEVQASVPIPGNIQNRENTRLVVMLYNSFTGEIANADQISLKMSGDGDEKGDEDAIAKVNSTSRSEYFTLDGKSLNAPKKGVSILRQSNGVVRKVVK